MSAPLLSRVLAQGTAVETLRRSLVRGHVHHAYLFDGPEGVGKELTALGLSQALLCERREAGQADACGACSACVRVAKVAAGGDSTHPDLIVLERGLYSPEKIGRRSPETQDLSIDQVRTLVLSRASFGPHEGRARVFLVRRADELSVSAANALLKTLEEPGRSTHFVLLSAHADAMLPTVRSRALRVRFAPLPEDVVARLLVAAEVPIERARAIALLARGSMAVAAALADPDESEAREAFEARALAAILAPDLGPALEVAEEAKRAKGALGTRVLSLAARLAERASEAARGGRPGAEIDAARYVLALDALTQLDGNAGSQFVVEAMIARMRSASS